MPPYKYSNESNQTHKHTQTTKETKKNMRADIRTNKQSHDYGVPLVRAIPSCASFLPRLATKASTIDVNNGIERRLDLFCVQYCSGERYCFVSYISIQEFVEEDCV